MRFPVFGIGRFAFALAMTSSLVGLHAQGASSLSALPHVGGTQVFNAMLEFTAAKGLQGIPHNQNGTLTVTRVADDSARFSASGGLDEFDQTLHVDGRGVVAQSSTANTFVDALDTVGVALAAAPANLQKDVKWSATVATPSWIKSYTKGALPESASSIPLNIKVDSVREDTVELSGVGANSFFTTAGAETRMNNIVIALDCTLHSGQLKSCTRTTDIALNLKLNVPGGGVLEKTTLTAK
jgi:hypothetical protein